LQTLTGRILLDPHNNLILPGQVGGEGVDRMFITYSIGKQLKIATFGLMNDVSLLSINKLAATVPGRVVESISLNDPRPLQQQIDDTVQAYPDLILFAGGTDRGAARSMKKMADLIAAILQLFPRNERPPVVYSGNQLLIKPFKDLFGLYSQFSTTANIRPDMDNEFLDQATEDLAKVVTSLRTDENDGFKRLALLSNDSPCPSAVALGRMTRFLSKVGDPEKGILSIDLGATSTTVASAVAGDLNLHVLPVGSAQGFATFLKSTPFSDIAQWFPTGINPEDALDQLWQKTLFPASIPMTPEGLSVELAAYRQLLRFIMRELAARGSLAENGYEAILCSGSALTQVAAPNQLLMMLLDGLQPKGISTIILDSHSILSALGTIARTLPLLPVQVLESTAFINLATVVSTEGLLRAGALALHTELQYSDGKVLEFEVKQGSIAVLPLKSGESAILELHINHSLQVESLALADTRFKVNGGLCGLVIDARGRPIKLPMNPRIREELLARWNSMLNPDELVR
jgi:hypothetical protein